LEIVKKFHDKLKENNNKKEGMKSLRIPLQYPRNSGKALCSNSLYHRLKVQKDDLLEIQEILE